jgi:hypothetical protein
MSENTSENSEHLRTFRAQLDRLMSGLGVQREGDLARILEVTPQAIASARSKNKLPLHWHVIAAEKKGLSLDWLVHGFGSMRREEKEQEKHPNTSKGSSITAIDEATGIVLEAASESGVSLNERQIKALIEIVREELKGKALRLVQAIKG